MRMTDNGALALNLQISVKIGNSAHWKSMMSLFSPLFSQWWGSNMGSLTCREVFDHGSISPVLLNFVIKMEVYFQISILPRISLCVWNGNGHEKVLKRTQWENTTQNKSQPAHSWEFYCHSEQWGMLTFLRQPENNMNDIQCQNTAQERSCVGNLSAREKTPRK